MLTKLTNVAITPAYFTTPTGTGFTSGSRTFETDGRSATRAASVTMTIKLTVIPVIHHAE
jgi:hypothetical protein